MTITLRNAVVAGLLTMGGLGLSSQAKAQNFGFGVSNVPGYGKPGFSLSINSGSGYYPGYPYPGYPYPGTIVAPSVYPVPVPITVPGYPVYRPPYYPGHHHGHHRPPGCRPW